MMIEWTPLNYMDTKLNRLTHTANLQINWFGIDLFVLIQLTRIDI